MKYGVFGQIAGIFVADVDTGRKILTKEANTLHQCHPHYGFGLVDVGDYERAFFIV
jgi:hypothetical protein